MRAIPVVKPTVDQTMRLCARLAFSSRQFAIPLFPNGATRIFPPYIFTMIAFAFFVRLLWFLLFTQPSIAVDLWCGKAYKEGYDIQGCRFGLQIAYEAS